MRCNESWCGWLGYIIVVEQFLQKQLEGIHIVSVHDCVNVVDGGGARVELFQPLKDNGLDFAQQLREPLILAGQGLIEG